MSQPTPAAQRSLGIVTNIFPSLTTTFVYGEIAGLRRYGLPVRVYSVRRPAAAEVSEEVRPLCEDAYYLLPPRPLELVAAQLRFFLRRPVRYLLTMLRLLSGQHDRLRDRLHTLIHFAAGVQVAARAQRDGVGHLHAHFAAHAATVALAASWLLDVPFSFTAHAYDIWQYRLLLPQKLRACRFAVTCTRVGAQELLGTAPWVEPAKVLTIYHGVDVQRFSPAGRRPEREFTILSVSQLRRAKGQHLVLAALRELAQEGYRFHFRIVGEGPSRHELEELTRLYGLERQVSFAGRVYHEDLPDYYRQADLFVLPCYRDGRYRDNLPNVLLEAMACGLPVISSRLQGIPELIEDGVSGLLVEQYDVASLARAIRRLMDDRGLADRMGQAARRRVVEQFDQARSIGRLAALYRSQLPAEGTRLESKPPSAALSGAALPRATGGQLGAPASRHGR